jgi:hypothetical protein
MTTLAPELAAAYLETLTATLRAVAVLGPDWSTLAGDAALGARAEAALREVAAGEGVRLPDGDGAVHAARSATHAVAAAVGPGAPGALVAHDLRAVLCGLAPY